MANKTLALTSGLLAIAIVFSAFVLPSRVYATSCPSSMSEADCIAYLQQQQNDLKKQQDALKNKINKEKSTQLSLFGQIDDISNEIDDTELSIKKKEVDVELYTIQVNSLSNDVTDAQTKIDTLTQETQVLEATVNRRIVESYKYSLIPPWMTLLQGRGLSDVLEKMRYLILLREEDQKLLSNLELSKQKLAQEYALLQQKQQEVVAKRNLLETENAELLKLRASLESKQKQKESLLAQSQERGNTYKAQKSQIDKQASSVDRDLVAIVLRKLREGELKNGTTVKKGGVIGVQGHTGCSFGSHLHFGIINGSSTYTTNVNPFTSGYLKGSTAYGATVSSGTAHTPMNGARVTQGFHGGSSIDMVSYADGNQNGDMYYKKKNEIKCPASMNANYWLPGYFPMRGEQAFIYSILDGTVYYGVDQFGGKYALVDHGHHLASIYWHLR